METNLISWTPTNIITITLMAAVGFFTLSLIAQGVRRAKGS